MLNEPTLEKLHALRLGTMADAWGAQQRDTAVGAMSFDERFALLVDAEYLARDNRRLALSQEVPKESPTPGNEVGLPPWLRPAPC